MGSNNANKPPVDEEWDDAFRQGDLEVVKSMLESGADINQQNSYSFTALSWCALVGNHTKMMLLLLDNGADLNIRDHWGRTALDIAREWRNTAEIQILEDAMARALKKKSAEIAAPDTVQPDFPWTVSSGHGAGAALSAAIESGDCQLVRELFDQDFWEGRKASPGWEHLKIAVLRGDEPMMRLLITWGARAPADPAQLKDIEKVQYSRYVKLLRQSGSAVPFVAAAEIPEAAAAETLLQKAEDSWQKSLEHLAETIPVEWQNVLRAFQNNGAEEAVIARGALCDLFNQRAATNVDIFLADRGSQKQNNAFLQQAFAATGLEVVPQVVGYEYDYGGSKDVLSAFPDPKVSKLKGSWLYQAQKIAENWTVVAGPGATEYNIVFVDGSFNNHLSWSDFSREVIHSFDFGLCQIAYNGREVTATQECKQDITGRKISLQKEQQITAEHLDSLVKKYPDWELCAESRNILMRTQEEQKEAKSRNWNWPGF